MLPRMRTVLALFLSLLIAPQLARADVVGPEPESCPVGSRPSTAHSGPYCAPTAECGSDSDCSAGTCMQVMQCIETRGCGGLMPPDAEPCRLEHVAGACAGDGSCAVGECRARRVCSSGAADGGCGCRVEAQHGAAWPASLAFLAGLALLVRRRR